MFASSIKHSRARALRWSLGASCSLLSRPPLGRCENAADSTPCFNGEFSLPKSERSEGEQLALVLVLTSAEDPDRDSPLGRNAALAEVNPAGRNRENIAEILLEARCNVMVVA